MLELIPGLPDHVLGISASGEVSGEDYERVLIPAIEERLGRYKRLRLIYRFAGDFSKFSASAVWEDTKVGMRHLTQFERIAVVADNEWITRLVRGLGFVVPGEVRVFANEHWEAARAWITEPSTPGKLDYELDWPRGILILEPKGELVASDFDRLSAAVDPYIESAGKLSGIVIVADDFPGWDDFAAFVSHAGFIRHHHDRVRRVALVTNSRFLSAMPKIAGLFLQAELRHFAAGQRDAAVEWVGEPGPS
jgi:hypothetical protein